jgi:hypothetical protein
MIVNNEFFKATKKNYISRYYGTFILALIFLIIFGFFIPEKIDLDFCRLLIEKHIVGILLFSGFVMLLQILAFFDCGTRTEILELTPISVIFHFFNKKSLELKYSEIESYEMRYIFKPPADFKFIMKNGEEKYIYARVENKELAFEKIQDEIKKLK